MSKVIREWVYTDIGFRQRLTFVRFNASERVEHLVIMVATAILAVTGLPQKFHEAAISRWLMVALGGIENMRMIHHFFAILLALASLYHIGRVLYGFLAKSSKLPMIPTRKDAADFFAMLRYFLGLAKERPRFDRFSYVEKFEYWALVWGNVIMGLTGFIMWFPTKATQFIDGVWVTAAKMAHGWEAVLAVLALLIWHVYHVHIKHFNTSIFTGKISKEEMLGEHPLEYARLMAELEEAGPAPAAATGGQSS